MKNTAILSLVTLLVCSAGAFAGDREGATILLNTAEKNLKDGKIETAQSMAERAIATDKEFPKAHLIMGQVLEQSNKAREAIAEYTLAAAYAKKEKDTNTETAANSAAKKLAPGLMEISQADQRLGDKLMTLGKSAMAEQQLDTAKSAFQVVVSLNASNDDAKKDLDQVQHWIDERGDPIKAKIAAAGMSEVYYQVGIGAKEEARKMAQEISHKYAETSFGKDAAHLLECNFDLSKTISQDIAAAKQELQQIKQQAQKKPVVAATTSTSTSTSSRPAPGPQQGVDIDAVEKLATEDAKKLAKDKLVSTFSDTFKKGKEFYSKATPGSEGNQKNVASALEQFIRCESLYMRIDDEKLMNADVEAQEKDASMLRYACMKMTILSH